MLLAEQRCEPLPADAKPLSSERAAGLLKEIPDWRMDEHSIEKEFAFPDFRKAMDFVNRVASIADSEDHHPDIHIYYNRVKLVFSTHKIKGLSPNDFIMAAKVSRL